RLLRLIRKELSESLRDRRTILTLVLMPVLLYPLLAMAFQHVMRARRLEKDTPSYRIGFASEEQREAFRRFWQVGTQHLVPRHAPDVKDGQPGFPLHLQPAPELRFSEPADLEEALRTDDVDVVVLVPPSAGVRGSTKGNPFRRGNF